MIIVTVSMHVTMIPFIVQAVDYDNYASNTKYCLAQLMHDRVETELGQSLMKAKTMRELW